MADNRHFGAQGPYPQGNLGGVVMVTSVYPRGLLPSDAVSDSWTTLTDAASWAGLEAGLARSFFRALGDQNLDSLAILAGVSVESIRAAVASATRGTRTLTPIEISQIFQMVNAVRVKFGGLAIPVEETAAPLAAPTVTTVQTVALPGKIKLKLAQIIDQGSDMEIEQMPHDELQRRRQKFVLVEGDAPLEKEEITDAQLSCLQAKVSASLPPSLTWEFGGPMEIGWRAP